MKSSHFGRAWLVAPVAVALATVAFAGGATAAEKPDATELEKVRAYVQPSIVYLETEWTGYIHDTVNDGYLKNGDAFTVGYRCSGYVVNPNGYIATAGHCVTRDSDLIDDFKSAGARWAIENGYYQNKNLKPRDVVGDYEVEPEEGTDLDDLQLDVLASWGIETSGVKTGQQYTARVIESQQFTKGDHALLKVEAKNLQALPLADAEPEVGQDIVSVGYPASVDEVTDETSYTPSYKDGSISSKKTQGNGLYNTYEISAAVSGGMSGGPTVGLDHNVIGVNSFGIIGEPQAFNFISAASLLKELMSGAGVKNTLGPVSRNYIAGIDAYFAGERDESIESLQKVLDEQPSNEMAQEFIKKAKALDEGGGLLPVLLIALAVLAIAGGAGAVMMRRGKKTGGDAAAGSATSASQQPVIAPSQSPGEPARTTSAATTTATLEPKAAEGAESQTKAKFCPSCGDSIEEKERFCANCGTPIATG
jgi:hypothetical protein